MLPPGIPRDGSQSDGMRQRANPQPAPAQIALPYAQEVGATKSAHRNEDAQHTVHAPTGYPDQDLTTAWASTVGCAVFVTPCARVGPRPGRPVHGGCPTGFTGRHDQSPSHGTRMDPRRSMRQSAPSPRPNLYVVAHKASPEDSRRSSPGFPPGRHAPGRAPAAFDAGRNRLCAPSYRTDQRFGGYPANCPTSGITPERASPNASAAQPRRNE